ncbi:proton-conducting transporter membrane subunit [Uliginosibacterium gangwonense]|uniref:proton-conducting transporter transmembrane domain-containing protein n=1 Tax=Uliginosibacterium gangwonense TaxID=392736 RepID=UPI0003777638|nr:proton-conducting transporter membrane subunit [Uliginosibacterium gangwonense]
MLATAATNVTTLAWLGATILLLGEIAALLSVKSLSRLIAISSVAELGYVLLGFGLGGIAGDTGAIMHMSYQLAMRGLVIFAAWVLIQRTGSDRLEDLKGSGKRMPVTSTLFGFGMFSVMGLSPFKGSFSKFIILYAALEQGHWLLAAVGTLASIIAAFYYMLVIQRICFEAPSSEIKLEAAPKWLIAPIGLLTILTVLMSLWPAPFLHQAAAFAHIGNMAALPEFESPWTMLVLVPYIGGFAIYLLGLGSARLRNAAAVLLSLATLVLALRSVELDAASYLFVIIVAAITFLVVLYSYGYMSHGENTNRYYFFVFLMTGSMLGLASAHEFGNFYIFWELMTWTSYFLVIHEQTPKALRAGFVYFLMCASGAYVMNFGVLLLHAQLGSFEFAAIAQHIGAIDILPGSIAALCLFIGFAVKAGFVPVHSWLPLAHPEAPSSISAPLSGILTKAGIFGMVKILFMVFGTATLTRFAQTGIDISHLMLVLGCLTFIYGEVMALVQKELKRMLAYSTLAQIGEIAAILGLGTTLATSAALLHVSNHAVMKTLLFFAAGAFILQSGRRVIADLAGLGRVMPFTAGCYALATVAIMGLPPFSGFISKFLMITAAVSAGRIDVAALLLLGSVIAAFYYLRVVRLLFFHPYEGPAVKEAPASMLIAIGILAAAIIFGGVAPNIQLDAVRTVAKLMGDRAGMPAVILPDLLIHWPAAALIATVGAVAVWLLGKVAPLFASKLAIAVPAAAFVAVLMQPDYYDGLSFAFALLVSGVGTLNMAYATGYMAHGHAQHRFYAAFSLMMAGLLGMVASHNFFNFFAFWELMSSWALYVALVHEENADARREAFKYFIFNTVGASFMFLGVAMLGAKAGGNFDFAAVASVVKAIPTQDATALAWAGGALVLIMAGMLMKAAMLPLRIDYQMHPATAPTPVSGYISAVLLKSGPYGVLKFCVLFGGATLIDRIGFFNGHVQLLNVIAIIGGLTLLYAGAMAVIQNGIKRLLIYSTVCQLGYITMALSLGTSLGVAGGLMHFVNHMMLKDLLFLCAGAIMVSSHARTLDELGGLGRKMPITFAIFFLAGLSLAGIPPLNGFSSKWLIYQAAFQSGHYILGVFALISSLFTLAAILKFAHAAFMGAPGKAAEHAQEAPAIMLAPMLILTAGCIAVGMLPGLLLVPIAVIQQSLGITPIAADWLGPLPSTGGWHPAVLSILLLVLTGISLLYLRLGRGGAAIIRSPIHMCGVQDLQPAVAHVGAGNLFETPEAAIRGLLHAKHDTGYSDDAEPDHGHATPI